MLKEGIKGTQTITVDNSVTAKSIDSGTLDVLSTPYMIALMEKTSYKSIEEYIPSEMTTVGTSVRIKHISATPVGMSIKCESELISIDGKRLRFKVYVYDEVGPIGEGEHERFIVNSKQFQEKANSKGEN